MSSADAANGTSTPLEDNATSDTTIDITVDASRLPPRSDLEMIVPVQHPFEQESNQVHSSSRAVASASSSFSAGPAAAAGGVYPALPAAQRSTPRGEPSGAARNLYQTQWNPDGSGLGVPASSSQRQSYSGVSYGTASTLHGASASANNGATNGITSDSHALPFDNDAETSTGKRQKKVGCCREFWTAPFHMDTWLMVLYGIFVSWPFAFFCVMWAGIWFGFSLLFFIIFPVGPLMGMITAFSLIGFSRFELFSQRWLAPEFARKYMMLSPVLGPCCDSLVGTPVCQMFTSCDQFWKTFKLVVFRAEAWKALGYFLFIKITISSFIFFWIVGTLVVALAGLLNWLVLLTCSKCWHKGDGSDLDWNGSAGQWLLTTQKGTPILLAVGFVVLCLSCFLTRRMSKGSARIAYACLGEDNQATSGGNAPSRPLLAH